MKRSFGKYLLLLVLYTSTAGGDVELECNQNGLMLKDALRESSCRIKGSVNDTERFGVGVRTKHGVGLGALICRILLMNMLNIIFMYFKLLELA